MRDRPFALLGAAGAQAAEAAGVCIASVLSAIDTAAGKSYQLGSGIALTVIGFCHRGRRWPSSPWGSPGPAPVEPDTRPAQSSCSP